MTREEGPAGGGVVAREKRQRGEQPAQNGQAVVRQASPPFRTPDPSATPSPSSSTTASPTPSSSASSSSNTGASAWAKTNLARRAPRPPRVYPSFVSFVSSIRSVRSVEFVRFVSLLLPVGLIRRATAQHGSREL